ncbi:MAG: type II toxin-antitoxin system VapC family toxin [Alphaproteobacteria bacterium]|nr:type II toxin-antitoxin system VapC family toxin [Alphaproteobacteria bacterium]
MIVIDTNVVSELMRPRPNSAVLAWDARQPRRDLFTTSITKAEVYHGIALLPDGRRKSTLAAGAQRLFEGVLARRILSFDATAAVHYAEILSLRRRAGRPMTTLDGQIAIALTAGAPIATRNVGDFEGCGLTIMDPWTAA